MSALHQLSWPSVLLHPLVYHSIHKNVIAILTTPDNKRNCLNVCFSGEREMPLPPLLTKARERPLVVEARERPLVVEARERPLLTKAPISTQGFLMLIGNMPRKGVNTHF
jgi:hypothetical protein